MIDYKILAKELIEQQILISNIRNQINAITTALIGALGDGEDVKVLEYDMEELKKLNLDNYIQIFRDAGKSVLELEGYLIEKYDEIEKLSRIFRSQNSDMKHLFKISPNSFLNQYFIIQKSRIIELQNNGIFGKLKEKAIEQGVIFNIINQENGVNVFFKTKEDLYKLQQIFCKLDVKNLSYKKQNLILSSENEEYLAYLHL